MLKILGMFNVVNAFMKYIWTAMGIHNARVPKKNMGTLGNVVRLTPLKYYF
jgi:hypothetical protein